MRFKDLIVGLQNVAVDENVVFTKLSVSINYDFSDSVECVKYVVIIEFFDGKLYYGFRSEHNSPESLKENVIKCIRMQKERCQTKFVNEFLENA